MTERDRDLPLVADFPPASEGQWLALVDKALAGAGRERLLSRTAEGLEVRALYTRADAAPAAPADIAPALLARSGAGAGRAGGWDIRQIHAEPDPARANAAIREDLAGGATSLVLRIAAPGSIGLEPAPVALAAALQGIDLDRTAIALEAGAGFLEAAGALSALWRERGLTGERCRGAFHADPLGTLASTGRLAAPAAQSLAAAAGLAAATMDQPRVTVLLADGTVYHAAGAGEAQELAAVLATVLAYLRAMEANGIAPGPALAKLAIKLAADADQFLVIAKLRAARRLMARIGEACGAGDAGTRVHITAETAWRMMARRDPWVNMLRTTIACAAAAMGGADAVTVLPFTWPLGRPDGFARRIARNTHLVLMAESGLGRVADPAAGSWYVERLTDDLARRAWELLRAIEGRGGMAAALAAGFVQEEVARVAQERAARLARGEEELTGVSAFPRLAEDGVRCEPWPAPAPLSGPGLVRPLAPQRLAEPFERLRDAADAFTRRTGSRPAVFLARLGAPEDFAQRATWAENLLAAGGIEATRGDGLGNAAAAAAAFAESATRIACLCSSDAVYERLAPAASGALRQAGAERIYIAGLPGGGETAWRAAGIDGVLGAGQDRLAALGELHRVLGIGCAS